MCFYYIFIYNFVDLDVGITDPEDWYKVASEPIKASGGSSLLRYRSLFPQLTSYILLLDNNYF